VPTHDLDRFVTAQAPIYSQALAELRQGRKQSHWMWFIFPQLAGLGRSATALHFGILSAEEAEAYLGHPLLGARLLECTDAVMRHQGRSAESILGGIDAVKFRSSMTLFEAVAVRPDPFAAALDAFYDGRRDPETLRLLGG
jgi:uncharacterized protein (DUF1810 family)